NANGCTGSVSVTTTVNANSTPSISGSLSFCSGSSTTLDAGSGYSSYNWSTGATTQTISVNTAGSFIVTVTNGSGCTGSANVSTTVNANPTPSISGSLSFCSGSSTTLNAGSGYSSYNWSNGATTQTISANTAGTFTVTVTNVNGCTGSVSVTTTVNANLTPSISGSLSFCSGSSTILNAGSGYTSYNWSNGATTQTISVNSAGTFTVTVTNANGCSGSASVVTNLNPSPTPSVSGSSSFCAGNSTVLNSGSGFSSYVWSTSATTQTITVNTGGIYTVSVTNVSGCTGSASKTVTVNALPSVTITGASSFCPPGSTPLNAGAGYSAYLWDDASTSSARSVSAAGTYTVTVTNPSGCTASVSKTITTGNAAPAQPGLITGATTVCKSSTETYSIAAVPGATSYTWTATSGASISTGQGSATVTVSFSNAAVSASISVVANNGCGTSIARTLTYTITNALPAQPSNINGQLWGLCNLNNVPYSCPATTNATSYSWTVPAGVTVLTGQGTNAITVKYTSTFAGTGAISVAAVSGCGSSTSISKTVNAKPQQPVISGQNWACQDQQGLTYSVAAVPGASSYTWTVVNGSSIVSGQGTTSITMNWGKINGVIKCVANNGCGNSLAGQLAVSFTCKTAATGEDFSELNLYPNPASSVATISFEGFAEGNGQLAVYDLIGKQVIKQDIAVTTGNNNYKLDLSAYSKGAYMVRVTYNGVVRNCKLIVQ
ncbi:MAG: T9SS type A sorting domain-containing protein, partial [Bacteroidia bacterium]